MHFDAGSTVGGRLKLWQVFQSQGKRASTQKYHGEIVTIFEKEWPALNATAASVGADALAEFIQRVAHYSAPRFNAVVSCLRCIVPAAASLKRRKVLPKFVLLPGQLEFAALLVELDNAHRGHGALIVRLLALSGMRIGEARRLTWADVTELGILVPPGKNGSRRVVPFIGDVREVLDRLRRVGDGIHVVPQLDCRTALAAACVRAGLPRMNHHDFRRMFATRCIECGVDLPTAARWMGHQDGGALLGKTYFHLLDGHSREMAGKVSIRA